MAFREHRLATGRLERVPAEAKMVEVPAMPPRAGDTQRGGPGPEASDWASSAGSWGLSVEF